MSADAAPEGALRIDWPHLDELVGRLAAQVAGRPPQERPEAILAVSRGGLVPGAMLAYRLGARDLLVAVAEHYDAAGRREAPALLRMPPDEALRGRRILIVDEVWESGRTLERVATAARGAGAIAEIAVLHYKPGRSEVGARPDFAAAEADGWILYPYKGGE